MIEEVTSPEDITLFSTPWVSGTRVIHYFGTVTVSLSGHFEGGYEEVIEKLDSLMKIKAFDLTANAIVGYEYIFDLFSDPPTFQAMGTAGKLEEF